MVELDKVSKLSSIIYFSLGGLTLITLCLTVVLIVLTMKSPNKTFFSLSINRFVLITHIVVGILFLVTSSNIKKQKEEIDKVNVYNIHYFLESEFMVSDMSYQEVTEHLKLKEGFILQNDLKCVSCVNSKTRSIVKEYAISNLDRESNLYKDLVIE